MRQFKEFLYLQRAKYSHKSHKIPANVSANVCNAGFFDDQMFSDPVFDMKKQESFLLEGEQQVSQLTEKIDQLLISPIRQQVITELKALE